VRFPILILLRFSGKLIGICAGSLLKQNFADL